jgi:hypothetical protein
MGIPTLKSRRSLSKIKFLPYALVGIGVFGFAANGNSSEFHPYIQIYLTLLELKLGILFVYLASNKLSKLKPHK